MRRAFAMPAVILLLVVAGVLVATLVERQSTRTLGVAREIDRYQEHQAARGLQEVLNVWLRSRPAATLHELTGPRGHAFDLELSDGSVVRAYLGDAQGSVLRDTGSLEGLDATLALDVLRALDALLRERGIDPRQPMPVEGAAGMPVAWTRDAGPIAVSAAGPVETVEAAARVALGGDARRARDFAEALTSAVREGRREDGEINRAAEIADADDAERAMLRRVVTLRPELWGVVIEVVPPGRTRATARYEALVAMGRSGAGEGRRGSFVRWRPVAVE